MSTNRPDPDYVAAQTGKVVGAVITDKPLEPLVAQARRETMTRAMGALVTFEGVVRDHDGGNRVAALAYEAHPSAPAELMRVLHTVTAAHPVRAWAAHRTGDVPIGHAAFIVVVAAAHRGAAFAACEEIADRTKADVPIWKEQELAEGGTQWVGLE